MWFSHPEQRSTQGSVEVLIKKKKVQRNKAKVYIFRSSHSLGLYISSEQDSSGSQSEECLHHSYQFNMQISLKKQFAYTKKVILRQSKIAKGYVTSSLTLNQ